MFAAVFGLIDVYPFGAGVLCATIIALCLLALTLILKRVRLSTKPPKHDFALDHTNMMILFQTMRDLLRSQKALARELNESIDKKIGVIKKVVSEAVQTKNEIREMQKEVSSLLKTTEKDCRDIAKRSPDNSDDVVISSQTFIPHVLSDEFDEENDENAQFAITPSLECDESDDVIDNWVGLDFGDDKPKKRKYDVPQETPLAPSDPEAAREAFRRLLNMDNPQLDGTEKKTEQETSKKTKSGNGRRKVTPLQARVYEYSDAGMTPGQISRELGIGKGEIRLIIGLRKDRGL